MGIQTKVKLLELHKTQNNLVAELRERGFRISPSELSNFISGAFQTPKADITLNEVGKIIEDWEGQNKVQRGRASL